jgi:hypothetical protein
MSGDGEACPWRRRFNLTNLDSTPPKDVLALELTVLTIVPSIAPDESSWTARGLSVVAPISAAARVAHGLRPSFSIWGGALVSSGLTDPTSMAPSPPFAMGGLLRGGGLRLVESRRLEETCGRIGTPWVSPQKSISFTCTMRCVWGHRDGQTQGLSDDRSVLQDRWAPEDQACLGMRC